jgi:hypothetical protein
VSRQFLPRVTISSGLDSDQDEYVPDNGSDVVTRTSLDGDSAITSPNDLDVAKDPSIVDSEQNLHSEEALGNFLGDGESIYILFFVLDREIFIF